MATPLPLSLKVPALGLPLFYGPLGFPCGFSWGFTRVSGGSVRRVTPLGRMSVKRRARHADITPMIISEEQVAMVLACKRAGLPVFTEDAEQARCTVSDEFLARVRASLDVAPDVRADRVLEARRHLNGYRVDAGAVVDKMLVRMLSDSLR